MKVKELREFFNSLSSDLDEIDVVVDTEAAQYSCHLVDVTGLYDNNYGEGFDRFICLCLDHDCKIH